MTKKLALTDVGIRALPCPEKGQRTHFDGQLPGFGVRVSQGGSRSFVVVAGTDRKMTTLGRYPAMSLRDARKAAMGRLSNPAAKPQDGAVLPLSEAVRAASLLNESSGIPETSGF